MYSVVAVSGVAQLGVSERTMCAPCGSLQESVKQLSMKVCVCACVRADTSPGAAERDLLPLETLRAGADAEALAQGAHCCVTTCTVGVRQMCHDSVYM
jgi:hypothetical protein